MALDLYEDGCIIGNIHTELFTIIFGPKCPHTKIKHVEMTLRAESMDAAKEYADTWIRIPQMTVQFVYPANNPPRDSGISVAVKRPTIRTKEG